MFTNGAGNPLTHKDRERGGCYIHLLVKGVVSSFAWGHSYVKGVYRVVSSCVGPFVCFFYYGYQRTEPRPANLLTHVLFGCRQGAAFHSEFVLPTVTPLPSLLQLHCLFCGPVMVCLSSQNLIVACVHSQCGCCTFLLKSLAHVFVQGQPARVITNYSTRFEKVNYRCNG